MHFRPKHEPDWEVVDHKEIDLVPTLYEDDALSTTVALEPALVPPGPTLSKSIFMSTFLSKAPLFSPINNFNSGSSSSVSSDTSDDEIQAPSPRTSIFRSKSKSPARKSSPAPEVSSGFTLSQTRDALRYARAQLLATDQVTKPGANVLLFEGWAVTHLRKGSQHRLQIRYSGRPARVSFASPPSSPAIPPFMELLPSL
ncbi:hypothetical protein FS837_002632 [Tulasnella sp. UAMH 9824]|nr:hypothetical protein FS837_002632 [Tulasnella sp. UAMH 9824]